MILKAEDIVLRKTRKIEVDDSLINDKLRGVLKNEALYVGPGLFDLQVNGYRGIDFNDDILTVEKIQKTVVELLKDGVTGFLATLITNDPVIIERNLLLFKMARETDAISRSVLPGIHLEGPFISSQDGARGAHPVEWVQKPDFSLVEKWQKISGGLIRLITLSPEYPGSVEFIKKCIRGGIRVAIGHTGASIQQLHEAVNAGATLSTHLGNGMSKEIHRHRNILYEQIASDNLFASIIADGHHLPESLLKIIYRSKPGKVFLVSDSTKFTGMPPGIYRTTIGNEIELREDRRLSIHGNSEYLAGTASTVVDCVNYLFLQAKFPLADAWRMASDIPVSYFYGREGHSDTSSEFVLFTIQDGKIKIRLTSKGERIFASS